MKIKTICKKCGCEEVSFTGQHICCKECGSLDFENKQFAKDGMEKKE